MSAGTRQRARRVPTTASARRAMREAVTVLLDQLLSVSPRSLSVESRSIPAERDRVRHTTTSSLHAAAPPGPPNTSYIIVAWPYLARRSPRRPPSRTETRMRRRVRRPNYGRTTRKPRERARASYRTVILARRRDRIRSRNGRIANGPVFRSRGERGESDVTDR